MKLHVLPPAGRAGGALLIHVRKTLGAEESIVNMVAEKRPQWGRQDLRVLEYGGSRRWRFQWSDETLVEENV